MDWWNGERVAVGMVSSVNWGRAITRTFGLLRGGGDGTLGRVVNVTAWWRCERTISGTISRNFQRHHFCKYDSERMTCSSCCTRRGGLIRRTWRGERTFPQLYRVFLAFRKTGVIL
jgi:hypothetical protein